MCVLEGPFFFCLIEGVSENNEVVIHFRATNCHRFMWAVVLYASII